MHWKSKYFEKTKKESHFNIFKSLEMENYFKQLLKKKGYNLHSYRLNFSNSTLHVFISAYEKTLSYKKGTVFKTKKIELLNKIKSKNILKTLNNFTKNKFHINLKILNLNSHNKCSSKKTSNINLSRYKIPEIEQLYPLIANQENTAKLLGTFMAEYLKTTKRHNFFLRSLKKSLNLILNRQSSKIKGIKILIKGRLNNAARSRIKYIKIGTIPLITKNQNSDYAETTAFTSNGTIGIKVWISHKKEASNFLTKKDNFTTSKINFKNF